jgi:hypothetical protein
MNSAVRFIFQQDSAKIQKKSPVNSVREFLYYRNLSEFSISQTQHIMLLFLLLLVSLNLNWKLIS